MSVQWWQQQLLERSVNVNTVVAAVGTKEVYDCQYSGGSSRN